MKFWILTFLFVFNYSLAQAIIPSSVKNFKDGMWEFDFDLSQFSTNKNFDDSGNSYVSLPNNNYYKSIDGKLGVRLTPIKDWGFFSSVGFSSAESSDNSFIRNNSAANDFVLGSDYKMYSGFFHLIPEVSLTYPFNKINYTTDDVLTGEGTTAFQARLILNKNIQGTRLFAYLGFLMRDDERAKLVPWGLGIKTKFVDFGYSFMVSGYFPAGDDKNVSTPSTRNDVTTRVNGGSLRYYSVNPSLLELNGTLDFYFTPSFCFKVGYGSTLLGTNTAYGTTLYAGISYTLDNVVEKNGKKLSDVDKVRLKKERESMENDKRLQHFEEDNEKIEGDMDPDD